MFQLLTEHISNLNLRALVDWLPCAVFIIVSITQLLQIVNGHIHPEERRNLLIYNVSNLFGGSILFITEFYTNTSSTQPPKERLNSELNYLMLQQAVMLTERASELSDDWSFMLSHVYRIYVLVMGCIRFFLQGDRISIETIELLNSIQITGLILSFVISTLAMTAIIRTRLSEDFSDHKGDSRFEAITQVISTLADVYVDYGLYLWLLQTLYVPNFVSLILSELADDDVVEDEKGEENSIEEPIERMDLTRPARSTFGRRTDGNKSTDARREQKELKEPLVDVDEPRMLSGRIGDDGKKGEKISIEEAFKRMHPEGHARFILNRGTDGNKFTDGQRE
ncbi:hypothetical protein C0995_006491 [Termitomyces sp. Mi166|nr:hypothetical protein C0995_006491 [Termitomyces sp. Mi166\